MHKLFEIPSITLFLCAFCAFLWLKSPFNQRNLRFKKYSSCLCGFVAKTPRNLRNPMNWSLSAVALAKADAFYKAPVFCPLPNHLSCPTSSTTVKESLQIGPFMQNEPKFPKSQMNVNKVLTMNYEKEDTWWTGKKRTQTNPNEPKQTQFTRGQN